MKIAALKILNYRTLEDVNLSFPSSYAAICGANDSGKTNIVRGIRALMKAEQPVSFFSFDDDEAFSVKDDFPKWKDTPANQRRIQISIDLEVDGERDAGFYQFLTKQLELDSNSENKLRPSIAVTHGGDRSEPDVIVKCSERTYTGLEAQQVLNRLQTSRSILFHNSTQVDPRLPFRSQASGIIRAESVEHENLVSSMKKTVNLGLRKISQTHQKEIESLLGRLETKYRVGLSMPAFDFSRNFHFELPLHPKTYASYPVVSIANRPGLFEVVVRHILAVLRSRCAGFACPACLAADTCPARPLLST